MTIIVKFFVAVSLFLLAGCMAGGTSGTGLSWGGGSARSSSTSSYGVHKPKAAVTYRTLRGQVENSRGVPVNQVRISSTTARSTERAQTDARGHFSVLVVLEQGGSADISFEKNGQTWNTKLTEIRSSDVRFQLLDNGDVRVLGNR